MTGHLNQPMGIAELAAQALPDSTTASVKEIIPGTFDFAPRFNGAANYQLT